MNEAKDNSARHFSEHNNSTIAKDGYWPRDYPQILNAVKAANIRTLLDIGCGSGAYLAFINHALPELELGGIDIAPGMVEIAQKRLGAGAVIKQGDSENLPIPDQSYDGVSCNLSFHHYPAPQAAAAEMYRVLKPGGTLFLNDMYYPWLVRIIANALFPYMHNGDVKVYTQKEIESILSAAGFSNIHYQKISTYTFLCTAVKAN